VGPADLAPDHAEFAAVDLPLGLVDVGHTLALVELSVRLLVHVLNLDERLVLVLVDLDEIQMLWKTFSSFLFLTL